MGKGKEEKEEACKFQGKLWVGNFGEAWICPSSSSSLFPQHEQQQCRCYCIKTEEKFHFFAYPKNEISRLGKTKEACKNSWDFFSPHTLRLPLGKGKYAHRSVRCTDWFRRNCFWVIYGETAGSAEKYFFPLCPDQPFLSSPHQNQWRSKKTCEKGEIKRNFRPSDKRALSPKLKAGLIKSDDFLCYTPVQTNGWLFLKKVGKRRKLSFFLQKYLVTIHQSHGFAEKSSKSNGAEKESFFAIRELGKTIIRRCTYWN